LMAPGGRSPGFTSFTLRKGVDRTLEESPPHTPLIMRKDRTVSTFHRVLPMAAGVAILLLGCSDSPGPIVAPDEASAALEGQGSLRKADVSYYTG